VNVQRGLYSISDNFFSFWYRFVFPNLSKLEAGDIDGVYECSVKPFIESYASKAFENVCIQFLRKMNARASPPKKKGSEGPVEPVLGMFNDIWQGNIMHAIVAG